MEQFPEQASTDWILATFIYTMGAAAVLLVVIGLLLVDMGLVRRRNVLDTVVQKVSGAMIGGFGALLIGYPIWQWQFNQGFGVPNPLLQAFKDWWLGGSFTNTASRYIDPAHLPEADVLQIFLVFFITFSMATIALVHTGAVERIKARPFYFMSFVIGGIVSPLSAYLCWGSLSPLTRRGVHDFDGVFVLYITGGTVALILAWRLGARIGAFVPHSTGAKPTPHNLAVVAMGVFIILFALPFITIGSGYIIPNNGFFGISMTESGIGIVIINLFASIVGGGLAGSFIAYRRNEASWALLGPISGVVICGTLFDVGTAWECLILGAFGPVVALGTAVLLRKVKIDEPKVVPLTFGPGIVGALATGFLAWGTKTGGYFGLEGQYAVGVAEITPWWQLVGVVVSIVVAGVPTLIMCLVFERFGGLRVSERVEVDGLDVSHWGAPNYADDLSGPARVGNGGQPTGVAPE